MAKLIDVREVLTVVGLQNPQLRMLVPDAASYSTLLFQPIGDLEAAPKYVRNTNPASMASRFEKLFQKARGENTDLVVAPEYSCPWGALEETIRNGIVPAAGSLWVIGCESTTLDAIVQLKGRLTARCEVIAEPIVMGTKHFVDPVSYLFTTRLADGAERVALLIQFKTEPMGDRKGRLEADNLACGHLVYRFRNTAEPSISLLTLICSDALRLAAGGDELLAQLDSVVNAVVIHLQLNDKPRDSIYSQYRYRLLRQRREREVIVVNWAKGTVIHEADGSNTIVEVPGTCLFMQSDETNCECGHVTHNHGNGLYPTYLGNCRAYAFAFNFEPLLFSLSGTKANQILAIPQQKARHGPKTSDVFKFDEKVNDWVPSHPAPDSCELALATVDPKHLALARSDPLTMERLFLLSCGRIVRLPDTPQGSFWPRIDAMESFRLASDEAICRLSFAQDQSAQAVKYRDDTLIPMFRIFEEIRLKPDLYPARLSEFKEGASLEYEESSPYTNLRNARGRRATVMYVGADYLDDSKLGPLHRVLALKLNGRSDTDEDHIAIWYRDGAGNTQCYPPSSAGKIDRVSTEPTVSITAE